VKPVEHLGTRKGNISKTKLMSLKLMIKTKILEMCTDALQNLRKVTNLQFILSRMRMVICSRIPSVSNRWKNFFNQVLNVNGVHDVRYPYS
jgi:hypothetical protein